MALLSSESSAYPMVLRNDAALLHKELVRSGKEVKFDDLDHIFERAVLTHGCMAAWRSIVMDGCKDEWETINAQPGIRLWNILGTMAEKQFFVGSFQARAGVIAVLQWVEDSCPTASPFLETMGRHPVWPVPFEMKKDLIELRAAHFGWLVCPNVESSKEDSLSPSEYSHVLLSESQLDRFVKNLPWSEVVF